MPQLAVAIAVVILVNAAFATVQEYRADRATEALQRMLPQAVRVRRDGGTAEVPAEDVVPGDVLLLQAGDRISADGDLLAGFELQVDESTLTGESWPVRPEAVVRAGTYVVAGGAEVDVTRTGMATEFGRLARLAAETRDDRSPLERELDRVTRFVAALSVVIGVTFFLAAGAIGMGTRERFVFAIGVMVANVPEGLLPTVTLSLALATQRMARRNALVRRLSAVEALGETTVICTDKTGTLTENELTAVRVWTPAAAFEVEGTGYRPFGRFRHDGEIVDPRPLAELLRCGLLCNDSRLVGHGADWTVVGDPTEGALVVLAEKGGLRQEQEAAHAPRLAELPFDSRRKRMSTVQLAEDGTRIVYVQAAPEELFPLSLLADVDRARAEAAALSMQRDALRVLAFARRALPAALPGDAPPTVVGIERDLELLGLVGMIDSPRPEVPDAVARCRAAGIRVVMVTGDAGPTAEAIGHRIGLVGDRSHVVSGHAMDDLDDDALVRTLAEREVIFARIDPEQKLRLARVLRAAGEVVAMTGDGVNDAPALREADIGVAMGSGSDVAKETADMILLDDNFASVVAAVEEGRAVYDNIRRFVSYHFCSNVAELVPFLVWGLSGGKIPLPLVVMQVLAIDLGTDMLPAIALGTEPAEPGTMSRPPRPRGERLLSPRAPARVYGYVGLLEGIGGLACFFFAYALHGWLPGQPLASSGTRYLEATTMTQTGIVMGQVGAGFAMRTNRRSIRSVDLLSNRFLLVGVGFELALAACLVYVPGLNGLFHQTPLGPWHWAFLLVWPAVVLGGEELRKAVFRRWVWSRGPDQPAARLGIAADGGSAPSGYP